MLAIGCVAPFGAFLVPATNWPAAVKAAVGGILFFAFEILAIPAVAIMGKDNYTRIAARFLGWVKMLKPAEHVGPVRHAIGIALFLLPIVPSYVMAYAPAWLPDHSPWRLWICLGADAMFLASLFILGGDFWDKLKALFIRDARAVFPGAAK